MSKKTRIQQAKLDAMELEFAKLLPESLAECAGGRWGLFGQNAIADPDDRYWTWPQAKYLRELAADICTERALFGSANPLAERFLGMCGAGMPNVEGEPKLAAHLLAELQGDATSPGFRETALSETMSVELTRYRSGLICMDRQRPLRSKSKLRSV